MKAAAPIARVIVDVPSRALSEPFDYEVPAELAEQCRVGCPVAVPLGGRDCVGYVVGLTADTEHAGSLRLIAAVLGVPVFDEHALAVAEWVASEYFAPLSEALKLFLPPGSAPKVVRQADGSWAYEGRQTAAASDRLAMLAEGGEPFVPRANATVQRAVLDALSAGPVSAAELGSEIPGAGAALKSLEKAGAVVTVERRRFRRPSSPSALAPRHAHTPEQAAAVDAIISAPAGSVLVLDGVTGSGKTEVYLAAIEAVLASGRGAICLVPEISLTPQTVGRFRSRLGDDVAVIHSRLSVGERFDQWQLALDGSVRVVVGARSALFAPVRDLGLVIIDEEHEPSYKQGQSPRYHAREAAERICSARGAVLVVGSATPSMESLYRVEVGAYRHLRLPSRVGGGARPGISVVDMTAEFANGNRSMYSRALSTALRGVAERGEKAVLFLNRRGFASFLLCRECGFVPGCQSCSVSLTYHEAAGRLQCHHCGSTAPVPPACPRCGSPYLRRFGGGTERAQQELEAMLPGIPVVRMDADTTSRKGAHEHRLLAFESLPSAVLLGTQMIAKGLDYPDVTLVGVLNADTSMHVPDFRAAERTYQLLEQVAGRAGRGPKGGQVVIQTYWPDHPAIRAVTTGDGSDLYEAERDERRAVGFPPYRRIANVVYSGVSPSEVAATAEREAALLRNALPAGWDLVGPSSAPIARLKGRWRWHFVLKAPEGAELPRVLSRALGAVAQPRDVVRVIDIDPVGML